MIVEVVLADIPIVKTAVVADFGVADFGVAVDVVAAATLLRLVKQKIEGNRFFSMTSPVLAQVLFSREFRDYFGYCYYC